MREIEEVKGAIEAYEHLDTYDYKNEKDLLFAHRLLMQNLLNNAGAYRHSNVGVGEQKGCDPCGSATDDGTSTDGAII